ncbi:MAG: hypothetical protein CSA09_00805 [Candidatus Contendobacter odensis]|uniref:Uncharacterized protein n=1 Tax=Candidatus Contendibacter odensensis TaxID=1400860 RepID=A0A2G6PFW3_9GAMM|nr:MAG: hypothetical protein CSA09_00805 [Candidatus Contendobacter odensis]
MASEFVSTVLEWIAAHPHWISTVIFITTLTESLVIIGIIVPGAVIMFTFGTLIGLGQIDFYTAWWWSTLGAITGDAISFWIGHLFHHNIHQKWPFAKHPELLTRSETFFRKHGGKSVLFGRFFGPTRGTIPTVAGMMGMAWHHFMMANIVSAILWAPAYLIPGMVFGTSLDPAASRVAHRLVALLLITIALLWLIIWVVTHAVRLFQAQALNWKPLSLYSFIALLIVAILHIGFHNGTNPQHYPPHNTHHTQSQQQWWTKGWQNLPQQRNDFRGQNQQDFVLQWVGTEEELKSRLKQTGWQPAPSLDLKGMLLWLDPNAALQKLPVLPQTHNGQGDALRWVYYDNTSSARWVLRFWDVGARLSPESKTIWIGSITHQKIQSRMWLFTFTADDPQARTPHHILQPLWQGLKIQKVQRHDSDQAITLITD